jgi:hypothetical protein
VNKGRIGLDATPPTLSQSASFECQSRVQMNVSLKKGLIYTIDDPRDVRLRKPASKRGQDGQAMDDVAQRARLNKRDALGIIVMQRWVSLPWHRDLLNEHAQFNGTKRVLIERCARPPANRVGILGPTLAALLLKFLQGHRKRTSRVLMVQMIPMFSA